MRPYLLLLVPYLLGALAALCVLRGRHLAFAVSSGLLWGLALHVCLATGPVVLAQLGGSRPYYDGRMIGALTAIAAATAAAWLLLRARSWGCSLPRIGAALAVGAGSLALGVAAALHWNVSLFTVDSFAYVEFGLALARLDDSAYGGMNFLGARGFFGVLLHAATDLAGVEYLYFLMPVLSVAFFATLVVAIGEALRRLGRSGRVAAVAALLCVAWLGSCYVVAYQAMLIHVNWLASMYVLLFFFCAWMGLAPGEERWFALAALALLGFVLIRVEGALFAAAFLAFLATEPHGARGRRPSPILALALPSLLWCLVVAALLGENGRIADRPRLLMMATALAASLGVAWGAARPSLREQLPSLQRGGIAALAAGLLILVALAPERMAERGATQLGNALVLGHWSTAWALVGALALAGRWLAPIPHQGFVLLGLLAYLLLMFGLSYVAPWREGWLDSGNRMLTHVLPSIAWVLAVKGGAIAPATIDPAESS
jgi:hypothetical protein